jgi:hypothetical protein
MQVIFVAVARARSLAGFPFGEVSFEFLVGFTNVGFVLHEGRKSLFHELAIHGPGIVFSSLTSRVLYS